MLYAAFCTRFSYKTWADACCSFARAFNKSEAQFASTLRYPLFEYSTAWLDSSSVGMSNTDWAVVCDCIATSSAYADADFCLGFKKFRYLNVMT